MEVNKRASILYEMPDQEGNEGCQEHNHEEWKASNPGCLSRMWDKDVQDREGLKLILHRSNSGQKGGDKSGIRKSRKMKKTCGDRSFRR